MASAQPILDLKPTFGWIFIGAIFAAVFYGVTVVQALFYFQTYPNDRKALKCLVAGIWILDTLSLGMISHATYTWLIVDFSNPLALTHIIWTIIAEPLCAATIALCVHLFMAYRIYMLNRGLVLLAIAIALVSFVPFGVGSSPIIIGLTTPGAFATLNTRLRSMAIVASVFSASLDIAIAVTLVTLIRRHRNNAYLKGTDRMVSALTLYLITNNLLTSLIETALLITILVAPKEQVNSALTELVSKAYTNTFLAQLNARESIRGRGVISTQATSNIRRDIETIVFNLGPLSGTHGGEIGLETADPTASSHSGNVVQDHSTIVISKEEKNEGR